MQFMGRGKLAESCSKAKARPLFNSDNWLPSRILLTNGGFKIEGGCFWREFHVEQKRIQGLVRCRYMRNIRLVLTVNGKLLGSAIIPKHSN